MTQNPYADLGQAEPFSEDPGPTRLSILAVVALVCSITCLLGPIGLLLGGISILLIAFSGGRKRGVGIAITAVVIGLISSVLLIGGAVGINSLFVDVMLRPGNAAITAVMDGDNDGLRATLDPSVRDQATDERIAAFAAAVRAEHGEISDVADSLVGGLKMLTTVETVFSQSQARGNELPSPIRFDNGIVLVTRAFDPGSPPTNGLTPPTTDLGVYGADGDSIWLFKDGASIGAAPAPTIEQAPADESPDANDEADSDGEASPGL